MVSGTYDIEAFIKNGEIGFNNIVNRLENLNISIDGKTIFDWGVGIGRIARFWKKYYSNIVLYASDYNPLFIAYVKRNIKADKVLRNNLLPPLDIFNNSVDITYAISVFTHLRKEEISIWLNEIYRILKPGGVFLFSVQGEKRVKELYYELYQKFKKNGYLEIGSNEGSNNFASFHSKEFIINLIDENKWNILEYSRNGAIDADQDLWIVKKREN